MRVYLIHFVVIALGLYAWRDWFKALCGLIVLTAFIEHPDMPKSIAGIQGANPWNFVLICCFGSWLLHRRNEGLGGDLPRWLNVCLLLYLLIVLISCARLLLDPTGMEEYSTGRLISDYLINPLKWVVPGLLLFDGCRSRQRVVWSFACIAILYILLAAQVIRSTSIGALFGQGSLDARRAAIQKRTGYNAVDIAAMLAGGAWAVAATTIVVKRRWPKAVVLTAAAGVALGVGLTGGRAGYVACAAIGFIMCALRWRRYLLLAPVIPILLFTACPGMAARISAGFGEVDLAGEATVDSYDLTSGRTTIWPYVIDKIMESPIFGYGQQAMVRTGLREQIPNDIGQFFQHPHNAYLEVLLDSGVIGLVPILFFFGTIVIIAAKLFRDRSDAICATAGGIALALVMAQLISGLGAQHFYPREGVVGMWAAIGIMLRMWRYQSQPNRPIARLAPIPRQVHNRNMIPL